MKGINVQRDTLKDVSTSLALVRVLIDDARVLAINEGVDGDALTRKDLVED